MIRVASYNIHKGIGSDRRRRPDRIIDVLREIDADVIALQEADLRFGARARVIPPHLLDDGGWKTVPVGLRSASMGWHGNALLVRASATIVGCEPIHLPALEPRGAVMADVRIDGMLLRVVGMHLDLSGLWRRRQAAAILSHVARSADAHPTVLMGDLNEWRRASGCLRDFARDHRDAPTGPSFHALHPMGRLDRIMASPDWRIVAAGTHGSLTARQASDHLPIWADLELA